MKDLPDVVPKILTSVSPSHFNRLITCSYSYLLKKSLAENMFQFSQHAKLGTLWHSIVEEINLGRIILKHEVEERWFVGVQQIDNQREVHQPPTKWQVKNFSILFHSLIWKLSSSPHNRRVHCNFDTTPRLLGPEVKIDAYPYKGTIDLLENEAEGLMLTDYKTGPVLEISGNGDQKIKEIYSDQLKVYAAMIINSNRYVSRPNSLVLQSIQGERYNVPFTIEECLNLFEKGRSIFEKLNQKIRDQEDLGVLANVNKETCKFCDVRMVCAKFKEHDEPILVDLVDIDGSIQRIFSSARILMHNLLVEKNSKTFLVTNIPWSYLKYQLAKGDDVYIMNVKNKPNKTYSFTARTVIYKKRGSSKSPDA